jgi:hypothetical protein
MALEWAQNIKTQPDLNLALDINEANILELLEEIRILKKEKRKLERDNDVLYFDLQNWKPHEPLKRGRRGLELDDEPEEAEAEELEELEDELI